MSMLAEFTTMQACCFWRVASLRSKRKAIVWELGAFTTQPAASSKQQAASSKHQPCNK